MPNQIPALLKLVEVCVDGGLEATMYEAQAQLADAYLGVGQAAEARVIAEDLVAREPWERAHIERFRRALMMLRVSDPDSLIAARLSGQAPFIAPDIFADRAAAATSRSRWRQSDRRSTRREPAPEPAAFRRDAAGSARCRTRDAGAGAGPAPPAADEIDLNTALGDFSAPAAEATAHSGVAPARARRRRSARRRREPSGRIRSVGAAHDAGAHLPRDGIVGRGDRPARDRLEGDRVSGSRPRRCSGASSRTAARRRRRSNGSSARPKPPRRGEEDSRALLYDLGTMVEESGDTARALAVFLELQSEAGDYRDVAERVERLARVEAGG